MATLANSGRTRNRKSRAIAIATILIAAARYWRAAERDERHGYLCTAAFEWRKAADLLSPIPALADQCWRQWERLMRLPRALASPVSEETTAIPA